MEAPDDGRVWYAHDGRAMPIAYNRKVYLSLRGADPTTYPHFAGDFRWYHHGHPDDIMFYTFDAPVIRHKPDIIDWLLAAQDG